MPQMVSTRSAHISIHALREEGDDRAVVRDHECRGFLSTPSARRATDEVAFVHGRQQHFYPRPPRGGRHEGRVKGRPLDAFLSTPSARRATLQKQGYKRRIVISIHALREEGDATSKGVRAASSISIHALREEGDASKGRGAGRFHISIHALREEGDGHHGPQGRRMGDFYPRPPRGGRPCSAASTTRASYFYPRPPRGGRQPGDRRAHDPRTISIHALREEGDATKGASFLLPSRFLSTPSARRATTALTAVLVSAVLISIHALREEGDYTSPCP